ncbi:glycoside hydrolase family 37 protein [Mixia osmundae IAM 14324]|uniref:Trehalase n=1 Tax=Mixia osmundae (strain CBS 9802 / IAM 14324 / JCM 22182 / KY 12970) TaxID=764103 RepID=G7DVP6_MIXOS|nr:glycoside hydrolase family 37 protein [Mixia osmundae IAM 14324]KEI39662.1 glycoside hydrolase family 37 protein [Mixia osmundae IAM 14324]GAA94656.1 hypothetical protein E5Q_01309 [Mixia osmundae IAM 14324]
MGGGRLAQAQPRSQSSSSASTTCSLSSTSTANMATREQLNDMLRYIKMKWTVLTRSPSDILAIVEDPKWPLRSDKDKWPLYVAPTEDAAKVKLIIDTLNLPADRAKVEVIQLRELSVDAVNGHHGALWLPYPYPVPGGRFAELYAWDGSLATFGIQADGLTHLAQSTLDAYTYSIDHYGFILNGNRTYYLSRSQLPFYTTMVVRDQRFHQDQAWLAHAYAAAKTYYAYWTQGPHFVRSTGLSRFFDLGRPGSAPPEVDSHEKDSDGKTAHDRVKAYYRAHWREGIPDYDILKRYDPETDQLTAEYFDNDRAMRESGFDTSRRFGMFGAKVLDINPVCLNSLLYAMETELAMIAKKLNRVAEAKRWTGAAEERKALVNKYMWNERDGLFYDYDHVREAQTDYCFGTTFLPLHVGLASAEQAAKVRRNALRRLEVAGGLMTSDRYTRVQWDAPYAWEPLQYFAVSGLDRYGFKEDAKRIAANNTSMMLKIFLKTGEIWEKYNAVERNEEVHLDFGYSSNEPGFAFSNAFATIFARYVGLDDASLLHLDGIPVPAHV